MSDFHFSIDMRGEAFSWLVKFRKGGKEYSKGGASASPFRCFSQMVDYLWSVK